MDIRDASANDLEWELERRKHLAIRLEANKKHVEFIRKNLTQEIIDFFFPEHIRSSCSDGDLCNGWYTNENGSPRCGRCAMIETLRAPWSFPEEFVVQGEIFKID